MKPRWRRAVLSARYRNQWILSILKVKVAKRVAVIGGGLTGVEIAAELRAEDPKMDITLVHGREHLLMPDLTAKGEAKLQNMLTKEFKIKLMLGDCMEENTGQLKVDRFLQVEGKDGIYALGDCTNVDEPKLAIHCMAQAETLMKTIIAVTYGCGQSVAYKPNESPVTAIVSLGHNGGFAETKGGWGIPVFVIKKLKSKDLIDGQLWKDLYQTPAK